MRRRLFNTVLLIGLAAVAAVAQQTTRVWLRVVPDGEEFAVHFPEPHLRIRRELPFGEALTLRPASFEITHRGALLSVLSFSKSEPATPKTLDAFVKGLRRALDKGGAKSEPDAVVEAQPGVGELRRLRLTGSDYTGTASIFETPKRFYVLLTLGGPQSVVTAEHFQNSFTLDAAGMDRVPLSDVAEVLHTPLKPPAPLWPVAGGTQSVGILVGDKVPGNNPSDVDASKVDASKLAGKTVISGGVLNGKAIAKPQPVYPPIAKAARAQGVVTVQIVVDEEGYVISASAVSGHPLLQQAAVFAARQARFSPTLLEGQPVKVSGVITYNFVLA